MLTRVLGGGETVNDPNDCVAYEPIASPATLDIAGKDWTQGGQFTWTCYNDYEAGSCASTIGQAQSRRHNLPTGSGSAAGYADTDPAVPPGAVRSG